MVTKTAGPQSTMTTSNNPTTNMNHGGTSSAQAASIARPCHPQVGPSTASQIISDPSPSSATSAAAGCHLRRPPYDHEARHATPPEDWVDIEQVVDARPILPLAAFFMGDLRDGLPMLNMQAAFLISAKGFNEKQVGILFFVFGMSQFLCMAPAGYFLDYSNNKIDWVLMAGTAASALTVLTAMTAQENGNNMALMIVWKILQGGVTAILPPGYNGITLGIVGSTGFTHQVSRNRMMNHIGTALVVAFGSLIAYYLYPNIGHLFIVSPIAAIGMAYNLRRIKPTHVDRDAARGLIIESPTMNEYDQYDEDEQAAAVAAAALSWQMMEDDPNTDKQSKNSCCDDGNNAVCGDSQRNAELLNTLSGSCNNSSYCSNNNDGNSSNHLASGPSLTCPYESFSSCGTNVCIGTGTAASTNIQSPASATSSAYMPPDILNSDMGPPTTDGVPPPQPLQHRNNIALTSPIKEDEEQGFTFETIQLARQEQEQGQTTRRRHTPTRQPDQPHPLSDDSRQLLGRKRNDDSRSTTTYESGPSFNLGYNNNLRQHSTSTQQSTPIIDEQDQQDRQSPSCNTDLFTTPIIYDPEYPMPRKARTPLAVLRDPNLMVFTAVIFFFHLANSSVLPLVMQSLALRDPQAGILLSGLCILIAQAFMSYFAKLCGDYSPTWGRKNLTLVGLASLTLRCFLLTGLVSAEEAIAADGGSNILKALILSTQLLDAVGAGIIGCLHILVTNDISGGTGRFSLMLGVTTGAMCLGGTVSGYIGQAIAHDYGYPFAFISLGIISLVPFLLFLFFMPETLPDYARPSGPTFKKRRKRLAALLRRLSEHRRRLVDKANPFLRRDGTTVSSSNDNLQNHQPQSSDCVPAQQQNQQQERPTPATPATATTASSSALNSKTIPLTSHVELV